jgi:hypothetical protein
MNPKRTETLNSMGACVVRFCYLSYHADGELNAADITAVVNAILGK